VTDAVLLMQKIGLGVDEGEDGDRLAELVVQPTQGVDDEGGVGDGGAAVVEGVGMSLEAPTVLADSHVALVQAVELLLSIHHALKTVVEELAGDGVPDGVGDGVGAVDIVPNFFGDGVVQPRNNVCVDLKPFGVVDHGSGIDGAVNVTDEAEFLEGELERDRHCRKLPSSADSTTGTWLRMLSRTRVEAVGGAGSAGPAKGLVSWEAADCGLAMDQEEAEAEVGGGIVRWLIPCKGIERSVHSRIRVHVLIDSADHF
jgi:hypothetical protein